MGVEMAPGCCLLCVVLQRIMGRKTEQAYALVAHGCGLSFRLSLSFVQYLYFSSLSLCFSASLFCFCFFFHPVTSPTVIQFPFVILFFFFSFFDSFTSVSLYSMVVGTCFYISYYLFLYKHRAVRS